MSKPAWYDSAAESARNFDRESLEPGGHRCVLKKIEQQKSKSGLDMYVIYYDTTDDDRQPSYYLNVYVNDTSADKVWRGRSWLVVDEKATTKTKKGEDYAYGQANLARLTTAIEDSNEGFEIDWTAYPDAAFLEQFKDKKIGIVFGKEYYSNDQGEARAAIKPRYYCNIDKAEEQKIPEEKGAGAPPKPAAGKAGLEGFMQLNDALDDLEGIPFN